MVQTQTSTNIILEDKPSLAELKTWWAALQQDPARNSVYTDLMPRDLDDFITSINRGRTHLLMFRVQDDAFANRIEVGGAFFLHDFGVDSGGSYAWLGTYILPKYRRLTLQAWTRARRELEGHGFSRLFVATLVTNRHVQLVLRRSGFKKIGTFRDWGYFGGVKKSVFLYTLHEEDRHAAWVAAAGRSSQMQRAIEMGNGTSSLKPING